ncbi:MAG: hypothetical protein NVS2B12_17330 [Ktedonobacteraceae bacterium]
MKRRYACNINGLIYGLLTLFVLDRFLKLAAIVHFFRRPPAPAPQSWPTLTLLQPITRGASDLAGRLQARAQQDYPATIQHLFICDARDKAAQAECTTFMTMYPNLQARLILVEVAGTEIATKIEKLLAALPYATGEVFWFLDDDVAPRPDAARTLVAQLLQPGAGAVFGLACYTNWRTVWSSLMSAFVNANALLSYISLTYVTSPFTITGHCFALRREVFERVGGFERMEGRIDDDHEMARRVRRIGLGNVQTPVIYDVDNDFTSWPAYRKQMKRWFILPRQTMLPFMSRREQLVSLLGSLAQWYPALLFMLALCTRKRVALGALAVSLGLYGAVHALNELCYLKRRTPLQGWLLLPVVALFVPLHILWALLASDEIEWRGQRLRIHVGGKMEVVS